ncbi:MAG: tRNA 4-thiouridine(8) synthase ThiI [Syntrophomonas sp.]
MKAISLFSGGLDSQLAVCLLKEQGLEVIAMNFATPFFGATQKTYQAAQDLQVELMTIDISDVYMDKVLRNPVYGYGKNINPCIDCHAFMLKTAGQYMESLGASFLATGEVLGQRPMSQNKSALQAVEKLSGMRGLIVRPLSGRLLPSTIPENEGWIDREKMQDISGRSRKPQMELAEYYKITDYPSPAGGCLLTDQNFARRLFDLLDKNPAPGLDEIEILKLGRHFQMEPEVLLVIGRNHSENEQLKKLSRPGDLLLKVADRPGPLALIRGKDVVEEPQLQFAASLVARYSDAKNEALAPVKMMEFDETEKQIIQVAPAPQS